MIPWWQGVLHDRASFAAFLRTVLSVGGVLGAHWAGAPPWMLPLIPCLTQAIKAGETNPPPPQPTSLP